MASSHWHARGQLGPSEGFKARSKKGQVVEPDSNADPAATIKEVGTSEGSYRRTGQKKRLPLPLTMHRALDGSAMLTLGMLVQRVVSETIRAPDQGRSALSGISSRENSGAIDSIPPRSFINVQESWGYAPPTIECSDDDTTT